MTTTMDIAVCIDCSSSITSNFDRIRLNILSILNEALTEHQSDVRMALIQFRSHYDNWVTKTHPFTSSMDLFQEWINAVQIDGENSNECKAIVDALDESLALEWRSMTNLNLFHEKLVILITDGPPCNLLDKECSYNNKDLWELADEFDKQNITLVIVGIEPSVVVCDDFYCALAHKTGGEYIPLINSVHVLTSVIKQALLEDTLLQSFRHLDIHLDIEYDSLYSFLAVQKRADFMIEYCRTMTDIRKCLYTYRNQPTELIIDEINDDDVDHFVWKNINIIISTPITDDEGYRTRLPTTASAESSFIDIIGSSASSYHTDFDLNSEIDDECF
ncbi:unnamed protein product [Rotaria socialis]|uniref:VWFA domain-containing protein n=1 Tax=Rotaria socialis TaxID=392032 RepID=A0A820MTY7_9BILA|nr:unnamed protein product [Rotaria socialis]CAF3347175.1 unnamed protein product [Rotaria socialis]CAF3461255.1 unnamed protein product [Rotaria socialis]CAF3678128.1 unnamed protein product [Rotaria socialis]CAF3706216.1 unnamed protein product [Rotaria socialis]